MYNPTRNEARDFFFDAWSHYRASQPLTALEQVAVEIIGLHPEYHALLEDRDHNLDRDWQPEHGETNPFLHLSLHLSIAEQLATDRPEGIRAEFDRLAAKHGDGHAALHDFLECLGETMWRAQRSRVAPDPAAFLELVRQR